jgi:dipeptide/tripeptide permease
MELFERWAYYGMFTVLSVYMTDPISKGGLGFSQEERGVMQAVVTAILYLLPILGGAIADRFGFRKVLLAAFITLASGYFAMGQFSTYATFFVAFLIVAVGGAIFKPIIVATVSKTSAKGADTLGFGIFYMIVNIGGFIGPWAASKMRDISWEYVFIMCSGVIFINLILLIFYREPAVEKKQQKESLLESMRKIIDNTFLVLANGRFVLFLAIMIGFWVMYMQLFFTVPVYITQWVNTNPIYEKLGILQGAIGYVEDGSGIIRPEMIINLPAFMIIVFQLVVSGFLTRIHPVKSMVVGIAIVAGAWLVLSSAPGAWIVLLALAILSFGEMASSPRIQEYISRIAPKDKVALYMGYSFLPLAAGNLIGGLLSGILYGKMSDKYIFLRDLLSHKNISFENSMDNGELFLMAQNQLGLSKLELNNLLYQNYHPHSIWYVFAGIGLFTSFMLFFYHKIALKGEK